MLSECTAHAWGGKEIHKSENHLHQPLKLCWFACVAPKRLVDSTKWKGKNTFVLAALMYLYKFTGAHERYINKDGSKRWIAISPHRFSVWLDSERVVFQEGNFVRFNGIWARLIHFAYLPEPEQPYWKVGASRDQQSREFLPVMAIF